MTNTVSIPINLSEEQLQRLKEIAARQQRDYQAVGADLLVAGIEANVNGIHRRKGDLASLMRFAGSINMGHPLGLDNDAIDAELARQYEGKD